jgi:hypothetical protein
MMIATQYILVFCKLSQSTYQLLTIIRDLEYPTLQIFQIIMKLE